MTDKTVVALYDHFDDAKAAVTSLLKAGVARDNISLLANSSNGDHPALSLNPAFAREEFDVDSNAQPGIITGAEVGIGLGGLLGFLAGISTIAIPGIGFLIAAGTWATVAAGATAGGVIGATIGVLTDHGVSNKDAHLYAEGLKRGGTLVTVITREERVAEIKLIFRRQGAVDIEGRNTPWLAEGWVGLEQDGAGILAFNTNADHAGHVHAA